MKKRRNHPPTELPLDPKLQNLGLAPMFGTLLTSGPLIIIFGEHALGTTLLGSCVEKFYVRKNVPVELIELNTTDVAPNRMTPNYVNIHVYVDKQEVSKFPVAMLHQASVILLVRSTNQCTQDMLVGVLKSRNPSSEPSENHTFTIEELFDYQEADES